MRCNYDVITSPAHASATATALHAAWSVTGARYRETGKTGLGGGMTVTLLVVGNGTARRTTYHILQAFPSTLALTVPVV